MNININDIVKVSVRLEGMVNTNFKVELSDGSIHEFYSIEGSIQSSIDDERLYKTNPTLDDFLEMTTNLDIPVSWNEDEDALEYDYHPKVHMVNNVVIQSQDGDHRVSGSFKV